MQPPLPLAAHTLKQAIVLPTDLTVPQRKRLDFLVEALPSVEVTIADCFDERVTHVVTRTRTCVAEVRVTKREGTNYKKFEGTS